MAASACRRISSLRTDAPANRTGIRDLVPKHRRHACNHPTHTPLMFFLTQKYNTPNAPRTSTDYRCSLTLYRFRSAWACLQAPSPLKADKLKEAKPLQPLLPEWLSTNVSAKSSPRSRSSSVLRGIGIADEGDSFVDSAATT